MRGIAGVVVLVGLLTAGCGEATLGSAQDRQPGTSTSPATSPTRLRLVGLGHAAIAVPHQWATNALRCAEPMEDTVVIDVAAVPLCGATRPKGVESVEVTQGEPAFGFEVDETFTVGGVKAQRQATSCAVGAFGGPRVCVGSVYLPSLRVSFRAESSTGAADVGRMLGRVRVVPDRVGVPGYQLVAVARQERSGERYVEVLREAGLIARVQTRQRPAFFAGFVMGAAPRPGTMLRPGAVVHVTVGPERSPTRAPAAQPGSHDP